MSAPGEPREPATQALLEAAAKAIHEHDREVVDETCFDVPWDELSECYKPYYRAAARAARAVIGARLAEALERHVYLDFRSAAIAGAAIRRLCGIADRGPQGGPKGDGA